MNGRSSNTPRSMHSCMWALTNPGTTASPAASITRRAETSRFGPTATMTPASTAMSPGHSTRSAASQQTTTPPRTSRSTTGAPSGEGSLIDSGEDGRGEAGERLDVEWWPQVDDDVPDACVAKAAQHCDHLVRVAGK